MRIVHGAVAAREVLLRRTLEDLAGNSSELISKLVEVFGGPISAEDAVQRILDDVARDGDTAVCHYSEMFDGFIPDQLEVTLGERRAAWTKVDSDVINALEFAAERIRQFHKTVAPDVSLKIDDDGIGYLVTPLDRVGLYAPQGRKGYPSTVLMTAIPARVSGVPEILLATPSGRFQGTDVSPATLVAADIAGVDRVFRAGGAQAIAAFAFGTETIPQVRKICGPGNPMVQIAKRRVFGIVDVDTIQGPTETIVLADENANPSLCAADLLAQAEHDVAARPILLTPSGTLAEKVSREIDVQLAELNSDSPAHRSIERNGGIAVVDSLEEAILLSNEYAPEHLCLLVDDPWGLLGGLRNAGGIFLGESSPEALGDFVAGPSHVMPTGGAGHFASPLGVDDFLKRTSIVGVSYETVQRLGPVAIAIAEAEEFPAHARAVGLRLRGSGGR